MRFVADVHVHSYYSRATSKTLNLEHMHKWAQLKGIQVVGTGDFVHPGWFAELQEKLEPSGEEGLFRLKKEYADTTQPDVPGACEAEVRFLLSVEISNIYKRLDKVRKVHNLVYAPDFEAAGKLQARLEQIGNIRSDGRPILGLDSRDLLEITLETGPLSYLIPAHIWTPWFSALGSKGGFDRMSDCFGDLTHHIPAAETGLSSDPPMNWRLSQLDPYILVSNSDAHSPQKLGREATIYDTDLSYRGIYDALHDPDNPGLQATLEFFPEEGKYHFDGHRACKARMHPRETLARDGNCVVCNKPVTVGVMARVEALADRSATSEEKPPRMRPFVSLVPLTEVIAEAIQRGVNTKSVQSVYQTMLSTLGNELFILQDAPIADIDKIAGSLIGEGIRRMRSGDVEIAAGYDGEFGVIRLFGESERKAYSNQSTFLPKPGTRVKKNGNGAKDSPTSADSGGDAVHKENPIVRFYPGTLEQESSPSIASRIPLFTDAPVTIPVVADLQIGKRLPDDLNSAQWKAVTHTGSHLLIVAGPGTGKTHTLTHRIIHFSQCFAQSEEILALTFTNRAADEMLQRLKRQLPDMTDALAVGTFHSFAMRLLRQHAAAGGVVEPFTLASEQELAGLAADVWPDLGSRARAERLDRISMWKGAGAHEAAPEGAAAMQAALSERDLLDYDDLILNAIALLRREEDPGPALRSKYRYIFVDEYQDINAAQHEMLRALTSEDCQVTAIGDPNQAIYGFRGADSGYFTRFSEDFPGAHTFELADNYRSARTILSASGQVMRGHSLQVPELTAKLAARGQLTIHETATAKSEAEYVVHQVEKLVGGTSMFSQDSGRVDRQTAGEQTFGDIAVLFRLKAQQPALVEAFARSGIPFQTVGEVPLLDREGVAEIRTLLQFATDAPVTADAVASIARLTVPGVGKSTARKLATALHEGSEPFRRSALPAPEPDALRHIGPVLHAAEELALILRDAGTYAALQHLLVFPEWQKLLSEHGRMNRNWQKLLSLSRLAPTPAAFEDALRLHREADDFDARGEHVALLTLHAAKGLEFGTVFIVGCDDALLPLRMKGLSSDAEEERRLFYVGMTRAREKLYLVRAKRRTLFGKSMKPGPSPYLADISEQLKAYDIRSARPKQKSRRRDADQLDLFS